jgi:hypothetical protein
MASADMRDTDGDGQRKLCMCGAIQRNGQVLEHRGVSRWDVSPS